MTKRQLCLQKRNKKIAALYLNGKSLAEAGACFGLKKQMVKKILLRQGVPERKRILQKKPKLSPEEKLRIKEIKFWSRAALTADPTRCWEWQGKLTRLGYGRTCWFGQTMYARKVAWQIFNKKVSLNSILSRCGKTTCVNPGHLVESSMKMKRPKR